MVVGHGRATTGNHPNRDKQSARDLELGAASAECEDPADDGETGKHEHDREPPNHRTFGLSRKLPIVLDDSPTSCV
jgi:hypothetical protein